jgi:hypothetical protein
VVNIPEELEDVVEQASTSVGQSLPKSYNWTEWDSVLGPKHESVILDHGGRYGYTNNILHITDKRGVLWQVVESYDSGAKHGEFIFYEFIDDKNVTRRHGPMRYSHFLQLFGDSNEMGAA